MVAGPRCPAMFFQSRLRSSYPRVPLRVRAIVSAELTAYSCDEYWAWGGFSLISMVFSGSVTS